MGAATHADRPAEAWPSRRTDRPLSQGQVGDNGWNSATVPPAAVVLWTNPQRGAPAWRSLPSRAALAGATAPGTREAAPVASARGSGHTPAKERAMLRATIITSTILGFAAGLPLAVPFPALAQGPAAGGVPEGTVLKSCAWSEAGSCPFQAVKGTDYLIRDRIGRDCGEARRQDRAGEPGRAGDGDPAPLRYRRLRRHELRPRVQGSVHGHLPTPLHAGRGCAPGGAPGPT